MIDAATTDEDLVKRIQEGESSLYEVLMDRYSQPLHRLVSGILRGDSESEDVVQEAHFRAFTHLHQFRHESRFSTWLHRIAVNQALQYRRSAWRLQYMGDDWGTEYPTAPDSPLSQSRDPERQASVHELRAAVGKLRPELRAVVAMKVFEGLSTREIAARLAITETCTKTRLHRAKKQLRQSLGGAERNTNSWWMRSPSAATLNAEAA